MKCLLAFQLFSSSGQQFYDLCTSHDIVCATKDSSPESHIELSADCQVCMRHHPFCWLQHIGGKGSRDLSVSEEDQRHCLFSDILCKQYSWYWAAFSPAAWLRTQAPSFILHQFTSLLSCYLLVTLILSCSVHSSPLSSSPFFSTLLLLFNPPSSLFSPLHSYSLLFNPLLSTLLSCSIHSCTLHSLFSSPIHSASLHSSLLSYPLHSSPLLLLSTILLFPLLLSDSINSSPYLSTPLFFPGQFTPLFSSTILLSCSVHPCPLHSFLLIPIFSSVQSSTLLSTPLLFTVLSNPLLPSLLANFSSTANPIRSEPNLQMGNIVHSGERNLDVWHYKLTSFWQITHSIYCTVLYTKKLCIIYSVFTSYRTFVLFSINNV